MRHKIVLVLAILGTASPLSAAETQFTKPPTMVKPAPVQSGAVQMNNEMRQSMEMSRMTRQIAELRQQVLALQQDLAKLRNDHQRHYHTATGSFVPADDVVNNRDRYRGMRLWIVPPDASVGAPKQR